LGKGMPLLSLAPSAAPPCRALIPAVCRESYECLFIIAKEENRSSRIGFNFRMVVTFL